MLGTVPYYSLDWGPVFATDYITSNFAKIDVYAETNMVLCISESAKYDVSDLQQCNTCDMA